MVKIFSSSLLLKWQYDRTKSETDGGWLLLVGCLLVGCLFFKEHESWFKSWRLRLNKKVEEVYRNCIGNNEANIRYMNKLFLTSGSFAKFFKTLICRLLDKVHLRNSDVMTLYDCKTEEKWIISYASCHKPYSKISLITQFWEFMDLLIN